jgi:hypothetical protein
MPNRLLIRDMRPGDARALLPRCIGLRFAAPPTRDYVRGDSVTTEPHLIEMTKVLLITGPAGVGKSTLNWEVSAQLTAAGLRHAAIETDELDRLFPLPFASELERLRPGMNDISEINLASIWGNYRALGCDRLLLSGVMVFIGEALKWISSAIPNADFTVVRLLASNATLLSRLEKREIGPGIEDQMRRTLQQADQIAAVSSAGAIELQTDGKSPQELATALLNQIGWLSNPQ